MFAVNCQPFHLMHSKPSTDTMKTSHLVWQPRLSDAVSDGLSRDLQSFIQAQSLTAALRCLKYTFSVELLYLGEADTEGGKIFVRDVLLKLDGEAVVKARSECSTESVFWRQLLDCGSRPLGDFLFDADIALARSPFEFARVQEDAAEACFVARRSHFGKKGENMILTECFLKKLKSFIR